MLAIKWITKIRAKISAKIFFITLALLLVFTALIYAMLLLFLPNFYLDYKKQKLENGANLVVSASKTGSLEDVETAIDDFASANSISPFLLNSINQIIYIPFTEISSMGKATTAITTEAPVATFSSTGDTSVEKNLTIDARLIHFVILLIFNL
ncbi:hypothetical protein [Listeria cornellensis]|uniref:hypothetical protein n=1 Tax=Listeria cornellensis TaxID=1494961 RepID=UPI00068BAF09|nr:hypothetical protein [Listeria cornellensis]